MMEKFLKDYVKMYVETAEIELTKDQLASIVNRIMEEDDIWDTMDSYITDYLEEMDIM